MRYTGIQGCDMVHCYPILCEPWGEYNKAGSGWGYLKGKGSKNARADHVGNNEHYSHHEGVLAGWCHS